ncbi:hypothetical protein BDR26DRAFT_915365 [Obelidium mucronatum]|nr:hypothetical protein BDR26DRAFT_915365 [Obelidium mucronatum]
MSLLDYNYDASSSPALSSSSTFDSSANSEYNNNPDSPSPMSMASPQSEASSPTSNILNKTKRVYHRPATDKRRSQNRDAARKFRQKKETYKQELEAQIQHLSSGNKSQSRKRTPQTTDRAVGTRKQWNVESLDYDESAVTSASLGQ